MIKAFFSISGKANIGGHKGTTNTTYSIRKILESNSLFIKYCVKQPEFILRYLTYHKLYVRNIMFLKQHQ